MMHERRHKRYSVDLIDATGRMSMSEKVEVLDISLGGVALKADRRLEPGKEYYIKLRDNEKTLKVAALVVRSELTGMEKRINGETVPFYKAGAQLHNGSIDAVADFLKALEHNKKEALVPLQGERRFTVRFQITAPELSRALQGENNQPRRHALPDGAGPGSGKQGPPGDGASVDVTGRIASCRMKEDHGQTLTEIGSEFTDLTDKDKKALKAFIDDGGAFLTSSG